MTFMLLATLIAILLCTETDMGKRLRRLLIEAPAQALSRLTLGQIILAKVVLGVILLAALLFESEGLRLLGLMLPEGLAWLTAFDVATFVDLFATVVLIAAAARLRGLRDLARSALAWARGRASRVMDLARRVGRARQSRVRRPKAPPAKGDDGAAGWTPAWA